MHVSDVEAERAQVSKDLVEQRLFPKFLPREVGRGYFDLKNDPKKINGN